MIMGRLTITWHCYLLMILHFYLLFEVDFAHSNQMSFNSSSPNSKECSTLLQFKNITSKSFPECRPCIGPAYITKVCSRTDTWMEGKDCCSWEGVECDKETSNIIALDLGFSCLKGTLNLSFFIQFPHLESLSLAYNSLTGSIPVSLSKLGNVSQLDLSRNMLSGQIPDIFSNLRQLSSLILSGNKFDGPIPHSLCDLPQLSELYLSDNFLNGELPYCWYNISSLSFIDLSNNQLTGQIPDIFSNLGNLSYIGLSRNKFSGPIPHSLCDLPALSKLYLSGNFLNDGLPYCLFNISSLSSIDLSNNQLTGQIPDISSSLGNLSYIVLSGNKFSGPIPHSLCDLPALFELLLFDNFLNGGLPSCLFNMPSLCYIDLSNNQLSSPIRKFNSSSTVLVELCLRSNKINGPIPSSIFELVNLAHLDLSSNNLTGTFEFDMLPKYFKCLLQLDLSGNSLLSFTFNVNAKDISSISLGYLRLSSCNLTEFPSSLSSLKYLSQLDLSNNRIHGQIFKNHSEGWPSLKYLNLSHNFLAHVEHPWKEIKVIDLHNNSLQGSLLVPPLGTQFLFVSDNNLTGIIPPSFCNLSMFSTLDLSSNNLGGKIPECLGSYSSLEYLHLRNNSFHGRIPVTFCNKSSLRSLDLSYNNLEGSLPRSLNSCLSLEILNVGNNNLSDIFPYWLGNLSSLQIIVLKSNQFYGSINDSKAIFASLRILDLSYNKFVGHLSKKFFEHLQGMMLTTEDSHVDDLYMGRIPCSKHDSMYWSRCTYISNIVYYLSLEMKGQLVKFQKILLVFKAMDLSNNCFEGSIPEILGNFRLLNVLNLSHNSLTGNIPSSFQNLTALESLDLSSNKLDGRIPEQMKSLTFLEVLNLSYNKLSGPIPQGAQFATYESESFVGNKGLCGKPLPKKCSNDFVPLQPPSFLQEEDDTTNHFSWKIAIMGYGCGLVIGLSIGYIIVSTGKLQWLERMVEVQLHKKARRSC